MKKIIILLVMFFMIGGCSTFGNFANLKKGESTNQDVLSLLGEPAEKRFEDDKAVWQYQFVKPKTEKIDNKRTVLNLDIAFEENKVNDYNVTVSEKTVTQAIKSNWPKHAAPAGNPTRPNKIRKKGHEFIKAFDNDHDDRVSMREFPGHNQAFKSIDKNRDGFIDLQEALQIHSRRK